MNRKPQMSNNVTLKLEFPSLLVPLQIVVVNIKSGYTACIFKHYIPSSNILFVSLASQEEDFRGRVRP